MPRLFGKVFPGITTLLVVASPALADDAALHVRVDRLLTDANEGPVAKLTSDAEFLRRIYLDLAGRIPTGDEARNFLDNPSDDKRTKLIDRLLSGPDYPRRMRDAFHVLLMERRGDHDEWLRFLETSFARNKPWDQIVREILFPDRENEQTRGAAFFFTKRLEKYGQNPVDYPGLVRDVGRLFLGMDLQCAQCHDHPFIDGYKQRDFQGLMAFVGQTFIERNTEFPAVGDKPLKMKLEFTSVFTQETGATGPRLPGGMEVELASLLKPASGEPVDTQPKSKKQKGEAEDQYFSKLSVLAEQLPRAETTAFARNAANRLWYLMLGRGLVEPLDQHHADNPASHPELLELLAEEFVAHEFDVRWMLRELALSEAYQRSSELPDGVETVPADRFAVAWERALSAEQLLAGMLVATGTEPPTEDSQPSAAEIAERFRTAFANPPKEPEIGFNPSLSAALFVLNDDLVQTWLQPKAGNLVDRLSKLDDPRQVADELYLQVLTRRPTEPEAEEVARHLQEHAADRAKAVGRLVWALLASTEFCTNH